MSTHTSRSARSKGCGCRGACSCGCGVVDPCADGAFSRPIFFAGQLLTEEDLQGLADYVVEKNRLTNRHLFGDGVVCGLKVKPDPCKSRQVIVEPGHALDCCGNDILVPCEVSGLDVVTMIRDLRATLRGGYDCGDPCGHPEGEPAEQPADGEKPEKPPFQRYDLFIRYCETPADPVSPYQTEECDNGDCRASRLHEGYQFELRCPPKEETKGLTLIARLVECLKVTGPIEVAAKAVDGLRTLDAAHRTLVQSEKLGQELKVEAGQKALGDDLATAERELSALADEVRRFGLVGDLRDRLAGRALRAQVLIARARLLPEDDPTGPIRAAAGRVSEATASAARGLDVEGHPAEVDVLKLRQDQLKPEAWKQGDPAADLARKVLLVGQPVAASEVEEQIHQLDGLKDTLLRLADDGEINLEEGTHRRLRAARFSEFKPEDNAEAFAAIRVEAQVVGLALYRVLGDCFCEAFPPPCPPCDDPAVRIATLEVDFATCRVASVCNFSRRFVLTGPSIRYWISALEDWFEAFRTLCCPPAEKAKKVGDRARELIKAQEKVWADGALQIGTVERPTPMATGTTGGDPDDPRQALPRMTRVLASLADVTGQASSPLLGLSGPSRLLGIDPGETTADPAAGAEVERLKAKVERLEKALEKSQAGPTLFSEWASVAPTVVASRKRFLKEQFKARLNTEGLTTLAGDPNGKTLIGVDAIELKDFDGLPGPVKTALTPATVSDLAKFADKPDDLILKLPGLDAAQRADEANKDAVRAVWHKIGELEFLVERWPEPTIKTSDLDLPAS